MIARAEQRTQQDDYIDINLPQNYVPRPYQVRAFDFVANGYKRGVFVWHRRAGKDKTAINLVAKEMEQRIGAYYYLFPKYNQGRRILWDGLDRDGYPFMNHIPMDARLNTNNTEMKIKMRGGSLFQVIGSDNYDTLVGPNPIGIVLSEYALQDPRAYDFMRPILVENNGWAIFLYTPRGHNHGYELYRMARKSPRWLCQILTIEDTNVISKADIEQEKEEGMSEDLVQQEFYCSFEASAPGAYFAKEMAAALEQKRICKLPLEPGVPVDTFWDLGIDDSMTIWLMQLVGREPRLIGYYSNSGEGFIHYVNWLKDWRDSHRLTFGNHILPHDGKNRELQTGKSAVQFLKELKLTCDVTIRPKRKEDGIEASRQMIGRVWIDEVECEEGIEALKRYRKEYNAVNGVYATRPVHDLHSHGADSFQTLSLWWQKKFKTETRPEKRKAVIPATVPQDPHTGWLGR